ncbi:MAG: DGQHR domain-containing protein [Labilibaculum sp.]|nr:DGQHR domain-containing protein [Labilibaculum sp.]
MFEDKLKECSTDSEKRVAQFFNNIGLECADLNLKIDDEDGGCLGEIDGVFVDRENEIIIIYDDSTQSTNVNTKITKWFTKWKDKDNEAKIFDKLNIPYFPIHIIYIDQSKKRDKSNETPIKYLLDSRTTILYKDDFDYFEELTDKIGVWAKNDLYNFIEITPPLNRLELEVQQIYIGNYPAYVFADRPDRILKYSYVSRRRDNDVGYQRMVDYKRVKEMSEKLESEELKGFPNSILLNSTIKLTENPLPKSQCPKIVKLSIPNHYSSCRVVDGQHRLLSFSKLDFVHKTKFNLPIVLIDNMPVEEEIKLFLDINDTSKKVDPSLRYELMAKLNWEKGSKGSLIKEAVIIVSRLEKTGPLKGKVYKGIVGDTKKDTITMRSIVDSITRYGLLSNSKINNLEKSIQSILIKINKNTLNKDYFFSNRGVDLILGFLSKYVEKSDSTEIENIEDDQSTAFIEIVNVNISELKLFQGGQGFKNAIELVEKKLNTEIETVVSKV